MAITKRQRALSVAGVLSVVALAASPFVASAAVDTKNTTITATINAVISMTTSSAVAISLTPTAGGVVSSNSDSVSVSTNNAAGYNLQLADSDATAKLINGANEITAHAGTFASPTALATNTWGYRIVGVGGFTASVYSGESNAGSSTSTWAGVPVSGSPQTLKSTATTATNDATTVWYGVKVDTSLPTGAYADTVTYTATTNP